MKKVNLNRIKEFAKLPLRNYKQIIKNLLMRKNKNDTK